MKKLFWASVTVLVGFGSVVLAIMGLNYQKSEKPDITVAKLNGTAKTAKGVLPHADLEIAVYPNSMSGAHGEDGGKHPDWVSYGPTSNFQVPANTHVTITIKQYDGGEKLRSPYFRSVIGTVDGNATWNGKPYTELALDEIGHTFTIHSLPGTNNNFFLNVPLPAVPDDQMSENEGEYINAQVVTFTFITPDSGEYIWN